MTTRPRFIRLLLLIVLLGGFTVAAFAQDSDDKAAVVSVPEGRASARATMRTFLTAVVEAGETQDRAALEPAIDCLDLSGVLAAERSEMGPTAAIKLKEIIDRVAFVDFAKIPDARVGDPWVFYTHPDPKVSITIAPTAGGDWRFDAATVAGINELFRALEDSERVAGVAASAASLSPALWLRSKLPSWMHARGFLLEYWQWLALIVFIFIGALISRVVRFVLYGPVHKWLKRRQFDVPRDLLLSALRPLGLVFMALFWVIALQWIDLPAGFNGLIIVVVKFLAAWGIVRFAYRVVDVVAFALQRRADATEGRFDDLMVPLFRKSFKVIIAALGVVFIADVVGISASSLVAGLGLGGLAMALAAKDTVANFFGSLTVILDRPFEVGDSVVIAGSEGVVEEVGFRSTRLRTYENSLITIPNANLITAKVENLGARRFRRFKCTIGVTYDTSPEKLAAFVEGLRALINAQELTRKGDQTVYFTGLGASSMDILMVVYFETPSFGPMAAGRHKLLLDIVTLANRMGVEFAFATQTLQLVKAGDAITAGAYAPMGTDKFEEAMRLGKAEAEAIAGPAKADPVGAS